MSYSNITFFRYYPSDSTMHYTALQYKYSTSICQVKPSPQQSFDSLADWLATLPGQPTEDQLNIKESYALDSVDPEWNVPTWNRNGHPCQMLWPAYLYLVLMQYDARLKNNAAFRDAFNHFAAVDKNNNSVCHTYIWHSCNNKMYPHILMKTEDSLEEWELLPVSFFDNNGIIYTTSTSKASFASQVYEAYKPLYDLMEQVGFLDFVRSTRQENERHFLRTELAIEKRRLYKLQRTIQEMQAEELTAQHTINDLENRLEELE
jgi:hypothetical protein